MLLLSLLFSLAQPNGAQAGDDAALCAALQGYEEGQRSRLPRMVDEVTRMDRVQIDCQGRAMTMHKTLIGDPANLMDGWQERKRASWNELACGSEAFRAMIRNG